MSLTECLVFFIVAALVASKRRNISPTISHMGFFTTKHASKTRNMLVSADLDCPKPGV